MHDEGTEERDTGRARGREEVKEEGEGGRGKDKAVA